MRVLITGAAGFIGSQLAEYLLGQGDEVIGVDNLASYYDISQKRDNLGVLRQYPDFSFAEIDLREAPLDQYVESVEVVYHQAAQPGVRTSWASFPSYVANNVLATQRLLEACRVNRIAKLVYASSSSVYGNSASFPTREEELPRPHSPYGVSKLAAEQLVRLYGDNWGLPTVALRYFTVYGPRQRPDMAIYRLIESALYGRRFPLYGDGSQIRDFTYVGDVVRANALAGVADIATGSTINIAGGGSIAMRGLIDLIDDLTGRTTRVQSLSPQAGDVQETGGDIQTARDLLLWTPEVGLTLGLKNQVEWHLSRMRIPRSAPSTSVATAGPGVR
jgi:UDP-glucuronate 4-epimerase